VPVVDVELLAVVGVVAEPVPHDPGLDVGVLQVGVQARPQIVRGERQSLLCRVMAARLLQRAVEAGHAAPVVSLQPGDQPCAGVDGAGAGVGVHGGDDELDQPA
jgi:hypothetical protein